MHSDEAHKNADTEAVVLMELPSSRQQLVPTDARPPAPLAAPTIGRIFRWRLILAALCGVTIAIGSGYWWMHRIPPLPAAIVMGNGRIEADPIDIATKFAGRVLELRVDEGAKVKAGQVLAVMDTRDLDASLKKSEAQAEQAKKSISEATALLNQQHTQVILAQQEMDRAQSLLQSGWVTKQVYDQRQQALNSSKAGEIAAQARVTEAEHALEAAIHDAELYRVNIADNTLVAPRDGRIAYRIANTGEVLPAGGKIFTMLDFGYVYMDIYLPTLEAGRVRIGNDARIVLDAYADHPIPAKVTFIADQAQFTPKMVETQTERDKLMFRIRVRIDPARSTAHADYIRSGLPGAAYVLTDSRTDWPQRLKAGS